MAHIVGTPNEDELRGTSKADKIEGLAGNDHLVGNGGNDLLAGGPGNDTHFGFEGADRIEGGKGNDYLSGEFGSDTYIGGSGNDTFRFIPSTGADKILDFAKGDQLLLNVWYPSEEDGDKEGPMTFDFLDSNNNGKIEGNDYGIDVVKGDLKFDVDKLYAEFDDAQQPGGSSSILIEDITSLSASAIRETDYF